MKVTRLTVLVLSGFASLASPASAGVGDSDKYLTASHETEHFVLRTRPGSRPGAAVDFVADRAERDHAAITGALKMKTEGRFVLYLYEDVAELQAVTLTSGNAGFSAGREMHVPYDNDQTRLHEMVHVIALQLPRVGDEGRNLFYAEGLSNALLEFVTGVHVHAVAAYEERGGRLPALADMADADDFYSWLGRNSKIGAYDLAGSWFLFLLDEYGPTKVTRYYTGLPAKKAFGRSRERLEKAWHELLDDYELRPEVVTLMDRRRGRGGRFTTHDMSADERLPASLLGEPDEWTSLMEDELHPEIEGEWTRDGDTLRGSHTQDADWSVCVLGTETLGDCVVRATIRPEPGCVGVQFRLGQRCQALLTNAGTFVYSNGVVARGVDTISGREKIDYLMVRRGALVTIYIDGFEVVEARAEDTAHGVAIGVAGGKASFADVRVRKL